MVHRYLQKILILKFTGLAKSLCLHGKGVSVQSILCNLCQKPINNVLENDEETVAVWSCGHTFHSSCVSALDGSLNCPQCRVPATQSSKSKPSTPSRHERVSDNIRLRPDLEGHF